MTRNEKEEIQKYLRKGWSKVYGRPVNNPEVDLINANMQHFLNAMERIERFLEKQKKDSNN